MDRKKKLFVNITISIAYQITTLICGFVLPRFFLVYFGSEVNGLASSITQFLGFVSLCECGVGAVVQSNLYKPLAQKDYNRLSSIIKSSERFFRKIAIILVLYIGVLLYLYPKIINDSFDFFFTASLIIVISISSFAQYFFSMTYRILLSADQKGFVWIGLQGITLLLSTVVSVVLVKHGASIQIVKLAASIVFLLQPFLLSYYIKRHYSIDKKIKIEGEPIKQKWNGVAQHISAVVLGNTDVVVLTIFASLIDVSIYSVYNMIMNGVKQIVLSITNGVQSLWGDMYVREETELLQKVFSYFEWLFHMITTIIFSCTGVLIVPFVKVYTQGIQDADYIVPVFAIVITVAQAVYCLRTPYNMMVMAAGHFKETQVSAFVEVAINLVISILLVNNFGLVGVAVGTLAAMIYRTGYLVLYLKKKILKRRLNVFIKLLFVDGVLCSVVILFTLWIDLGSYSYFSWGIMAIKVLVISLLLCVIVNLFFYKENTLIVIKKVVHFVKNSVL